jgi:putative membrane protein
MMGWLVCYAASGLGLVADIDWSAFGRNVLSSLVFTAIGLAFFALAFWVICKLVPFSVRKEIEEDQNTSLAILIGSVIIGIAIIIAAAVHG